MYVGIGPCVRESNDRNIIVHAKIHAILVRLYYGAYLFPDSGKCHPKLEGFSTNYYLRLRPRMVQLSKILIPFVCGTVLVSNDVPPDEARGSGGLYWDYVWRPRARAVRKSLQCPP